MKYPCNMIKDLLPLYHDGVLSQESCAIVDTHLAECPACLAYYQQLCSTDPVLASPMDAEEEQKKAASFRAVKKKLRKKQVIVTLASLLIICAAAAAAVGALKNTQQIVPYQDNISVAVIHGNLVGRLSGSSYQHVKSLTVENAGEELVFFYFQNSLWDDITTRSQTFTEYTICSADKGAADIDAVYYYTGNYAGLANLNTEELQKVITTSALLWHR